jgi:ubiquinone/menaquinone biosynthesis C-methylase UbiE
MSQKGHSNIKLPSIDLAEAEIEKGNLTTAQSMLENLLIENEFNTSILNDLAVIHVLKEDYSGAVTFLKKILAIDFSNEAANGNIDYLLSNKMIVEDPRVEIKSKNLVSNKELEFERLQSNWNKYGETDPMWAILTDPAKKDNKWKPGEFFETGIHEIDRVIKYTEDQNLQLTFGRALDFGCGIGRLTQALAMKFQEAFGVDIAPSMIETANEHNRFGKRCQYFVNGKNDLSLFTDSYFDFIFTFITLQHMKPLFAKNYIREFMRILKSGGVLVFQIPSKRIDQVYDPKNENALDIQQFDPSKPVMEMHGVYRDVVVNILEEGGGKIIDILENRSGGPDWESFRYCVQKL